MPKYRIIGIMCVCLLVVFSGCRAKKNLHQPPAVDLAWHTALVTNTLMTLTVDEQPYNVTCLMQTVRDSMMVISIMPMLNMEMFRLEVTPQTAIVIDKINHRYTQLELSKVQNEVIPALRWEDLQAFASGSTLQQSETASLGYNFRDHKVRIDVTYGAISYDAPVNVRNIRLDRYAYVDINTLLQ